MSNYNNSSVKTKITCRAHLFWPPICQQTTRCCPELAAELGPILNTFFFEISQPHHLHYVSHYSCTVHTTPHNYPQRTERSVWSSDTVPRISSERSFCRHPGRVLKRLGYCSRVMKLLTFTLSTHHAIWAFTTVSQ